MTETGMRGGEGKGPKKKKGTAFLRVSMQVQMSAAAHPKTLVALGRSYRLGLSHRLVCWASDTTCGSPTLGSLMGEGLPYEQRAAFETNRVHVYLIHPIVK